MRAAFLTNIIHVKVTVRLVLWMKSQAQKSSLPAVSNPFVNIEKRLRVYIPPRINNVDIPGLVNNKKAAVAGICNTYRPADPGGKWNDDVIRRDFLATGGTHCQQNGQ